MVVRVQPASPATRFEMLGWPPYAIWSSASARSQFSTSLEHSGDCEIQYARSAIISSLITGTDLRLAGARRGVVVFVVFAAALAVLGVLAAAVFFSRAAIPDLLSL
jgi:hypothetical protein